MKNITLSKEDVLGLLGTLQKSIDGSVEAPAEGKYSKLAIHLLHNIAGEELNLVDDEGMPISKSTLEETTLDFTRNRTLSEEKAKIALSFIIDNNPYLQMFNSRVVKKLVEPVEAKAITQKNLISNEIKGSAVTNVNRRIVHNFGIELYLRHAQLQKNIPYQTVIDNLENPGWDREVLNDVAISLGNDILILALLGLGGNYASTQDFYDLNKGLIPILQDANGHNTNSYNAITVAGFLGKHLTPRKVDWYKINSNTYNAAALIKTMRYMYNAMPKYYRDNPNIKFIMSQVDYDLYVESRSDMTNPSNPVREGVLTSGVAPRFMGKELVALPYLPGINEKHEGNSSVYGAIILGDPKNFDIVMSTERYKKSEQFNARGSEGPVFEHTWDLYSDFQVARHDAFVIAFRGAKVETPYFVTDAGKASGSGGEIQPVDTGKYNNGGANLDVVPYCDTPGCSIVTSTASLAAADTLEAALQVGTASVVPQGVKVTLSADAYFRAYMADGSLVPSGQVWFDKAL